MAFNFKKYQEIQDFMKNNPTKSGFFPKIVAISKNKPQHMVRSALDCGVRTFGENRVQEAISKFSDLKKSIKDIELHLTGPLQRNKVKDALKIFDIFQTLDSERLAKQFVKYLDLNDDKKFFIQINIGEEAQKSGIAIKDSNEFIKYCKNDLGLRIIGLMCIPPLEKNPSNYFLKLKEIALKNNLNNLSMGMSADYKIAVESGATHIRIGTLLFGKRE